MRLTVVVPEWELVDSGRILTVGDREQCRLFFEETDPRAPATDLVSPIRGVAVSLQSWPGAELGRHPTRIDVDGGALYWDAPDQISGPIDVVGTISTGGDDAPDGFPETSGVLRRVRMIWTEVVVGPTGAWVRTDEPTHYEEVASTYLPPAEPSMLEPEVAAEQSRRAREVWEGERAAGRLGPGDSLRVGLKVTAPNRGLVVGARETRWTGALIDLDTGVSAKT